jgi:hypothetical protein
MTWRSAGATSVICKGIISSKKGIGKLGFCWDTFLLIDMSTFYSHDGRLDSKEIEECQRRIVQESWLRLEQRPSAVIDNCLRI